jgi:hypothetical protein
LVPELQGSSADIRLCLISDGKKWRESSPVMAEITRVICGGGRSSCPMMVKPRAKGALGSEDWLVERNRQMAKQKDN